MKKAVVVISVVLFLNAGCVSTKNIPMDHQAVLEDAPSTVTVTRREKKDFLAVTPGKAMFGLMGALAMASAGNTIIKKNEVEDPAVVIARDLSRELAGHYGMEVIEPSDVEVVSMGARTISETYPGADWIVDVETVNWGFGYWELDFESYRVHYSAKLRVVDARQPEKIAEGFCSWKFEDRENAPSHKELLADNAARLKAELDNARRSCIGQFRQNVLKIPR